jgi:hypothetical protein
VTVAAVISDPERQTKLVIVDTAPGAEDGGARSLPDDRAAAPHHRGDWASMR